MIPIQMMAYYTGTDQEAVLNRFKRVHRCQLNEVDWQQAEDGVSDSSDTSKGESSSGQREDSCGTGRIGRQLSGDWVRSQTRIRLLRWKAVCSK